jgi:hypothetical protein
MVSGQSAAVGAERRAEVVRESWGRSKLGYPALVGDPRSDHQSAAPVDFVLAGAIIVAFGAIYATFRIARMHGFHVSWMWVNAVYLALWAAFALAFGLVAKRMGKTHRAASIFAWITAAAAAGRATYWGFLLVADVRSGTYYAYSHYLPLLTAVALIAFGIAAHQPFRWWWSVPAVVAGFLDARASMLGLYRSSPYLGLLWLVPLVILGIAMWRTRVKQPAFS